MERKQLRYGIEHLRKEGPQLLLMGECDAGDGWFHSALRAEAFLAWLRLHWPACELRLVSEEAPKRG